MQCACDRGGEGWIEDDLAIECRRRGDGERGWPAGALGGDSLESASFYLVIGGRRARRRRSDCDRELVTLGLAGAGRGRFGMEGFEQRSQVVKFVVDRVYVPGEV